MWFSGGGGGGGWEFVSLNVPYQKEQEYIWFRGGDLNGF